MGRRGEGGRGRRREGGQGRGEEERGGGEGREERGGDIRVSAAQFTAHGMKCFMSHVHVDPKLHTKCVHISTCFLTSHVDTP